MDTVQKNNGAPESLDLTNEAFLQSFVEELKVITANEPEIANETMSGIGTAIMDMRRQRMTSSVIGDRGRLHCSVEYEGGLEGTIYMGLDWGDSVEKNVGAMLCLKDAEELHKQLGSAIEQLRTVLS